MPDRREGAERRARAPRSETKPGALYAIGLILSSIKAISDSSSPYSAYSYASISETDFDQSMSEPLVKSCSGTYFHV